MRKFTALAAVAVLVLLAWLAFPTSPPHAAGQIRDEASNAGHGVGRIPNAAAQAVAPKWEYSTIIVDAGSIAGDGKQQLNANGQDGWELCQAVTHQTQTFLIMKRPLK